MLSDGVQQMVVLLDDRSPKDPVNSKLGGCIFAGLLAATRCPKTILVLPVGRRGARSNGSCPRPHGQRNPAEFCADQIQDFADNQFQPQNEMKTKRKRLEEAVLLPPPPALMQQVVTRLWQQKPGRKWNAQAKVIACIEISALQ